MGTDEGYFDLPATTGTGNIHNDRLTHYSLGNSGNHGIDIVQTAVKHVEAFFKLSDFLFAIGHGCLLRVSCPYYRHVNTAMSKNTYYSPVSP
jgi:hypothetical protein